MRYRRFAPGHAASAFVDHYWTLEAAEPAGCQRVVPDGSPELIVHLGTPFESRNHADWRRQPRCFVAGQLTGPLFLRGAGPSRILGVTFRPDGLTGILDASPSELAAGIHALDGLDVEDIPQLEVWLLSRRRRPADPIVAEAVGRITSLHGACDMASLARDLGISTRQLERRFADRTGLAPKLFARMRRFQSVFPTIEEGGNWASIAAARGYYDQAHLVRDFREFAGEPPTALLGGDDLARHFLSHFSKTAARRFR